MLKVHCLCMSAVNCVMHTSSLQPNHFSTINAKNGNRAGYEAKYVYRYSTEMVPTVVQLYKKSLHTYVHVQYWNSKIWLTNPNDSTPFINLCSIFIPELNVSSKERTAQGNSWRVITTTTSQIVCCHLIAHNPTWDLCDPIDIKDSRVILNESDTQSR